MRYPEGAPLGLQIVVDGSYALACVSGCFFVLAGCLRFGRVRSTALESLANNAFGIYLLHYVFVVWLQYALLGVALFAVAKGLIVLAGSLLLAWATCAAMRRVAFGAALIGETHRRQHAASPRADDVFNGGSLKELGKLPPPTLARQ